ncbi:MAG: lactate utilization protein C [Propionibacterium sp.]|nr:lactate utilization protein C [Propionibacterium sp.]
MSAREEILRRIRGATRDIKVKDPVADVAVDWVYGQPTPLDDVVDTFIENIEDYKARITRSEASSTGQAIVDALDELGATTVLVPDGIDAGWVAALEAGGKTIVRDTALSHYELSDTDAVLTGARVAAADSGTICLDHDDTQGRRALTLVPDRHVCVVREDQVVSDIPEALIRLKPAVEARRPITWISGGSATSDIELDRVEGVHGPRQLFVVLEA